MYFIVVLAMVVFSVMAVTTRKILRAATYLLFTLFAGAALYFMLDYEFLGGVQIAVYAGGIVVLFVFAILLTQQPGANSQPLESRHRRRGLLAAIATFFILGPALWTSAKLVQTTLPAMTNPDMHTIGQHMLSSGTNGYLLAFEAVSVLLLACIIGGVVVARKR